MLAACLTFMDSYHASRIFMTCKVTEGGGRYR